MADLDIAKLIAGASTVAGIIWRRKQIGAVWSGLKRFAGGYAVLAEKVDDLKTDNDEWRRVHAQSMADLTDKVDNIAREVTVNGGSIRLRDLVIELRDESLSTSATLNTLINNSEVGMFRCDIKGACVYVSDTLSDMFRLDKSEMLGWGWLSGIHEEDRAKVRREWVQSVADGYPFDYNYRLADGRRVHAVAKALTVRDEVRQYHGVVRLHKPKEENAPSA